MPVHNGRPEAVLVTGSSGLLGGAVVRLLRSHGVRVVATDVTPVGQDVLACDVTDAAAVETVVAREHVTRIVPCGAISGPMVARNAPRTIIDVNVFGTANILEAARKCGLGRVVLCSSITVYGTTAPGVVTEAAPTRPSSVYAASKVAGEALMLAYAGQHGIDGVALRIGTVYGPGRRTACTIRSLLENAHRGVLTELACGPDFPRQYLYVDDAAAALVLSLNAESTVDRIYNIGGGSYRPMSQVVRIATSVVPGVDVHYGQGADPDDPDWQGPVSTELAAVELGYNPAWALADGMRAYAGWLQDRTHD